MIPHTLVLKPGLVIHSIYNGYWFWGRPSVEDLRRDLRAVTSEIRPDWDLSTPGLRDAWNAGNWAPFHDGTRSRPAPKANWPAPALDLTRRQSGAASGGRLWPGTSSCSDGTFETTAGYIAAAEAGRCGGSRQRTRGRFEPVGPVGPCRERAGDFPRCLPQVA